MGWKDAPVVEESPAWMTAPEVSSDTKASMGDTIAGLPITRFAMGAASPIIGAAQLGAQAGDKLNELMGVTPVVSPWIQQQLERYQQAKERGMKASGNEGYDWQGLLGSLAPTSMMAKNITSVLPAATSLAGRVGTGAVQGASAAAAQPIMNGEQGFWGPKASQEVTGAVLGGAIPLAGAAVSGIGKLGQQVTRPFTEAGRATILREFRDAIMGQDPAAKARMIQEAANAKPGVGGVMPTVGEVLSGIPESTGIAAHQADIAKLTGNSTQFAKRLADQQTARASSIGDIAKTPADLDAAMAARSAISTPLYEAARKAGNVVDTAPIVTHLDTVMAQNPGNRELVTELKNIKNGLLDSNGNPRTNAQEVSSVLDGLKAALAKEDNKFIVGNLTHVKELLVDAIPGYKVAQQTFANMSGPGNRMQVGQVLANALTSPLGTSERSGVMANAVRESTRTLKKATGQPRFDQLDEVLKPDEVQKVQDVAAELARYDAYKRLIPQTSLSGKDAIPGDIGLPIPNLLNRTAMVTNFVMRHLAKGAEEKIGKVAGQQYLNPPAFAAAMQPVPPRYQPMIDALMRQMPAYAGTTTGRSQ